MPALVIGYGNPLRADDGVGWVAAQQLAEELPDVRVQVLACHQLTPDLAEPLSRASCAIFIDARARGTPGQIDWQVITTPADSTPTSTHHLTPAAVLAYARHLYQRTPTSTIVVTVSGATFDYSDSLSPAVAAALPQLTGLVKDLLNRCPAADARPVHAAPRPSMLHYNC